MSPLLDLTSNDDVPWLNTLSGYASAVEKPPVPFTPTWIPVFAIPESYPKACITAVPSPPPEKLLETANAGADRLFDWICKLEVGVVVPIPK